MSVLLMTHNTAEACLCPCFQANKLVATLLPDSCLRTSFVAGQPPKVYVYMLAQRVHWQQACMSCQGRKTRRPHHYYTVHIINCNATALLPYAHGSISACNATHSCGQVADLAEAVAVLQAKHLKGIRHDQALDLVVWVGDTLEGLQALQGSSATGSLVGQHTAIRRCKKANMPDLSDLTNDQASMNLGCSLPAVSPMDYM